MREHDYTTLFKTEHMLKDVRLCLEEAQAAGVPFPAAAHARDLLAATIGAGHGERRLRGHDRGGRGARGTTSIAATSREPSRDAGSHVLERRQRRLQSTRPEKTR